MTLDPQNWQDLRSQGHRMLDDMVDYLETLRTRPVWQPIPTNLRETFRTPLPNAPTALDQVHARFLEEVLPYAAGNAHPGFFGWVNGGGTPVGMLAEMLAGGLNANLGGRDQMPLEVERQIVHWVRQLFQFPDSASGLFVTGTSMANLIALWVARTKALGTVVREQGMTSGGGKLVAYTSVSAHGCIAQAMDLAGLGTAALRRIPVDAKFQMDCNALVQAIDADLAAGYQPFFVTGTAGTVDVGAVDPLSTIAALAARHGLWFHVDGAFGALAMMAPDKAGQLAGIELADSIAFDFHKWAQVPYDAGFVLVRDGAMHQQTFAAPAAYLQRDSRGLAGGSPWPCDFGPDLSRGFRALKTWFTLSVYGTDQLGQMISHTCRLARDFATQVSAQPELELMAPVALNIVCLRYRCDDSDRINAQIAVALHESGIAAPSTTTLHNQLVLRVAIVNHRTEAADLDALMAAVLRIGAELCGSTRG